MPSRICALAGVFMSTLSLTLTVSPPSNAAPPPPKADDPAPASHDEVAAQSLFEEGKRLMTEKNFDAACQRFAASNRLSVGLGTTLWLADCHERAGRIASAWYWFRTAADMAAARTDKRRDVALAKVRALAPRLSRLRIEVSSADRDSISVVRDGIMLKREELDVEVPVDPGTLHVEARAPGKETWTSSIEVRREGVTERLTIPPLSNAAGVSESRGAPPPVPSHDAPHDAAPAGTWLKPAGIAAALVGGAAMVGSLAFGAVAHAKKNDADSGHCSADDRCDPTGLALRADGLSAAKAATILFVAGAAVTTAGVVAIVLAPSRAPNASKTTGGTVAVTVRF